MNHQPLDVAAYVGQVVGQAASPDGKIKVQVSSSGQLTALHIDPRAMRLGSQELADAIMDLSGRAAEDAARRVMEVTRPTSRTIGRETPAGAGSVRGTPGRGQALSFTWPQYSGH
jgi:DNA-binding protein YbaB